MCLTKALVLAVDDLCSINSVDLPFRRSSLARSPGRLELIVLLLDISDTIGAVFITQRRAGPARTCLRRFMPSRCEACFG